MEITVNAGKHEVDKVFGNNVIPNLRCALNGHIHQGRHLAKMFPFYTKLHYIALECKNCGILTYSPLFNDIPLIGVRFKHWRAFEDYPHIYILQRKQAHHFDCWDEESNNYIPSSKPLWENIHV